MWPVLEPDIADHNRVAGDDLAFVGGAIADNPIEPVRETDRPDRKKPSRRPVARVLSFSLPLRGSKRVSAG